MKLVNLITKKSLSRSFGGTMALLIFILFVAAFMLFPMVLVIGNSFKPLNELWLFPPRLLPINPTVNNFLDLFNLVGDSLVPITRYFFNTIFITVSGTVLHIILSSMCAFSLAKGKFKGKEVVLLSKKVNVDNEELD